MSQQNKLYQTPPYAVESALINLGRNLKIARRRRKLSIAQVAERIGTGVRAISDAEKGKPSTSVSVYVALLWAYDLLEHIKDVASPLTDLEGLRLSAIKESRGRILQIKEVDNDF